jgi:hypothetical protein
VPQHVENTKTLLYTLNLWKSEQERSNNFFRTSFETISCLFNFPVKNCHIIENQRLIYKIILKKRTQFDHMVYTEYTAFENQNTTQYF